MAIPANDHREIAGLITNAILTTFGQTTSFMPQFVEDYSEPKLGAEMVRALRPAGAE
jgi:hypothetical protein